MKLTTIFTALIAIISLAFCTVAIRAQVTAIKAGKLVVPETGTTATNQVILIEGRANASKFLGKTNTSTF